MTDEATETEEQEQVEVSEEEITARINKEIEQLQKINFARLRHLQSKGFQVGDVAIVATRLEAVISAMSPYNQAIINHIFESNMKTALEEAETQLSKTVLQPASADLLAAFKQNTRQG